MKGIFLGLTTIDVQYILPEFPKSNQKYKTSEYVLTIGGPAMNAAATFVHLGGNVDMYSVVGTHPMSSWVREQYLECGIMLFDLSPEHPHLPTIASVITESKSGDRSIITNKRAEAELLLNQAEKEWSPDADIILVDGFHIEGAIRLAIFGRKHHIPVVTGRR